MKVELVQAVCPVSTGNWDITGTTPAGDMVGALFFMGTTTTDNTNVSGGRFSFGATDLTNNVGISQSGADATSGANCAAMLSNSHCVFMSSGVSTTLAPVAAYSSTLTNGVRLNATTVLTGRLTNALLISGTDTVMKVGSQQFITTDSSKVINHGLGGTPDLIILLCSLGQSGNENAGTGFAIGFWDRTTTNQSSITFYAVTGANPTNLTAYSSNNSVGEILTTGATSAHVTLSAIGTSSFTINLSSVSDATNKFFGWIALRGASSQMFTKNQLMQISTSTGNAAIVSGMAGRPQAYLAFPTRIVSPSTIVTDDTAGCIGICAGVTNDYSTTLQMCTAATFKDNVATSVARNMMSNTLGILSQDNTGAADVQGTVNSWDSGGVTINYTNVGATLREMTVLAFGGNVPVSSATYIPRHTFRPIHTVYYPR